MTYFFDFIASYGFNGVIARSTLVMGLAALALNRRFKRPFTQTLLELLGRKIRR